ncbi:MAG: 5-formyltetrahydrofolate cyclo-ligase [Candidatus Thermoplasmatota archaeon]|nr:5-formyltetrahydrofolate cyclo-ligase [Candidatus Thermoplasmatota archaeon]
MKENIRNELKISRKNLSSSLVEKKSLIIKEKLFATSEFIRSQKILFYISYDNEVRTHEMIKESIDCGKIVCVPFVKKNEHRIIPIKLENWNDLEIGSYNILEPKQNKLKKFPLEEIELIIVPGIGFDARGNRIGHGMGYYDRLLSITNNCFKIGLGFHCQIVEYIPADPHDVRLDMVITEKKSFKCKI